MSKIVIIGIVILAIIGGGILLLAQGGGESGVSGGTGSERSLPNLSCVD